MTKWKTKTEGQPSKCCTIQGCFSPEFFSLVFSPIWGENILAGRGKNTWAAPVLLPKITPTKHLKKSFSLIAFPSTLKSLLLNKP